MHLALELTALSKMRPLSPIFDDEVITHKITRNYWVLSQRKENPSFQGGFSVLESQFSKVAFSYFHEQDK